MPHFQFIAKDQLGRNYSGTLYGATEQAVFFRLQKLGYVVLSVTEKEISEGIVLIHQKITIDDVVVFTKLLSTVISTGLPAVDALAALEEQTENVSFKKVIKQVREEVENGSALSAAFEKHPKVFPHFYISMVKSGEASGNLVQVLDNLTSYLERDTELKRQISSAFTYPKLVLLLAFCAIFVFTFRVIPAFDKIYSQADIKLPQSTRMMLGFSNFVLDNWLMCTGALVVAVVGFLLFRVSPSTKPIYDRLRLSVPVLGPINTRIAVSRTIRTLASMLQCGVPAITSLETARNLVDNDCLSRDLQRVIESVEAGGTISSPLRLSRDFSPLVTYMISAGEQNGNLSEMLEGCCNALEREINHLMKKLLLILEPMITVAVALIIGFIAIAMYLPIFNIVSLAPK